MIYKKTMMRMMMMMMMMMMMKQKYENEFNLVFIILWTTTGLTYKTPII